METIIPTVLGTANLSNERHKPCIRKSGNHFDLIFRSDKDEVVISLNEEQVVDLFYHSRAALEAWIDHAIPYHV